MATTPSIDPARQPPSPRGRRHERRRGRTAATRIDILKSAAKAFRRLGYHGATVEQIAAALQMNKGNLYYYFKNKEEILFACHEYSLDRLLRLLDDVQQSALPPDDKLRTLIIAFVHTILDELHGTALFLQLDALSPAHARTVIARRDRFDRGMRRIIEEGATSGAFDGSTAKDAKLLSFAILGAVNWIPRWYNPAGASTSTEIADRFAHYLLNGLR
jgi:AcrR family transcriptional regulator